MTNLTNIQAMADDGHATEAIKAIEAYLNSDGADNDAAWLLCGKLHWQTGDRRKAMNAYRRAVELNPESPARAALEQAYSIMEFFNPDIFNP